MDTNLQQRLVDEVIYLHSLWHQGPPVNPTSRPFARNHSATPNFTAFVPVPSPNYVTAPDSTGISMKRKRKRDKGKKKKNFTAFVLLLSPKYVTAPDSTGIPMKRKRKRKRDKSKSENGKKKKNFTASVPVPSPKCVTAPDSTGISTKRKRDKGKKKKNFKAIVLLLSPKYVTAPDSTGISMKRKRDKGKSENGKKKKKKTKKLLSDRPPDPGLEWPCPNPDDIRMGARDHLPCRPCKFLSGEDRLTLTSLQLQCEVFGACRKFFSGNVNSENDEFDENDDYDEDSEGNKEYEFFLDILSKNDKLRNYYETSFECGVFCCLVCGGMGKKNSGKRFKSCLGLLQHSIAIKKTEKIRAHLAFGRVICKVLAWDYDRLPMNVFKGEPLGRSLAVSGKLKDEPERNTDIDEHDSGHLDDNVVSKKISNKR